MRYAALARKVGELRVADDELGPCSRSTEARAAGCDSHARAGRGSAIERHSLVSKERGELQRLSRKERIQLSQLAGHCRSG